MKPSRLVLLGVVASLALAAGAGAAPVALFTASGPGPGLPVVREDVTFDASASFDTDGSLSIVLYEWDFDDDGTFEVASVSPTAVTQYPAQGVYPVTLRITNDDDPAASATLTLFAKIREPLFPVDAFEPGDQLARRDIAQGVDWLPPVETVGESYQTVASGLFVWKGAGFRHASFEEVCTLIAFHAAPSAGTEPCPPGFLATPTENPLGPLQDLFGLTFDLAGDGQAISGHFDDGNGDPSLVGYLSLEWYGNQGVGIVQVSEDSGPKTFASPSVGHFLVRPISVPAAPPWALAALATALAVAARAARPADSARLRLAARALRALAGPRADPRP